MSDERDRLLAQKKRIEDRIRELEYVAAYRDRLTPEQLLAYDLHAALCRWNHTDGCGWLYEQTRDGRTEWTNGTEHKKWLKHARTLVEMVGIEKAVAVVPLLKDIR